MTKTGLVLAGHGSHISPNTAGCVWELVDVLREQGFADEITAAFWKETPSFHQVLDMMTADDITIVPLFTAKGYFTDTVIPTEMGLCDFQTWRAGRLYRYTPPVGEHPFLAQIVRDRVQDKMAAAGLSPNDVTVAIAGHGTKRSPQSRALAEHHAAGLRAEGLVRDVVTVYLEDLPDVSDVYAITSTPVLIIVPFFLALGSHTSIDIPQRLGLGERQFAGENSGRIVYCTLPVGLNESLCDIVTSLAHDAGAPFHPRHHSSAWDYFPGVGRDELVEAVVQSGSLLFGELEITPVRVQIAGDAARNVRLESPAELRRWLREEPFRPLATARGLRSGWYVELNSPDMIHAVAETIYPGAVADWACHRQEGLQVSTLHNTAARQTGILRDLERFDSDQQLSIITDICESCTRHPTWFDGISPAHVIPCAEPCNFWMSAARGTFS